MDKDQRLVDVLPFRILPAIEALLLQCLSLLFVLLVLVILSNLFDIRLPLPVAVLLQGFSAAVLSYLRRMATWWLALQLFFPLLLFAAMMLHVSPKWYLLGFLIFSALYWHTFRTQVPYYPSGPVAWQAVAALLPTERGIRFVDVGSGFGGMVLHLASLRADCEVVGIELAPLPWLASCLLGKLRRSKGSFLRGNYNHLDFRDFDVVFAYLSPAAMPALWRKACAEMKPGSLLLSYEFAIAGVESHITNMSIARGRNLYGWIM